MRAQALFASLLATSALAGAGGREPRFRFERLVVPGVAGPNRLEPDVGLLAGAAPLVYEPGSRPGELGPFRAGLADLRFFDAAGREAPYLVIAPPSHAPVWRPGQLLPIAVTKTDSSFEVDFGAAARTLDRVRIAGLPAPFLKRFRLEGSGDRSRWTLLIDEGTLFDLPDEGLHLMEMPFQAGEYRYLRVTWDDRESGVVPLPRSVA